jgi:hypothetical protein
VFVWGYRHAKNLLAYENLQRIHGALEAGPIFGMFYRSHNGQGTDFWIGSTYADFQQVILNPKPGDEHIIWSLPALLAQDKALVAARYTDLPLGSRSLLSAADVRVIEEHLIGGQRDVLALFFGATPDPEASLPSSYANGGIAGIFSGVGDITDITDYAEVFCGPGGEAYVFPYGDDNTTLAMLDSQTASIERPEYWLVSARFPDDLGRVPIAVEYRGVRKPL